MATPRLTQFIKHARRDWFGAPCLSTRYTHVQHFQFASYRFLALLRYLARYVAQKVRRDKSRAAGGSEESRKRAWETEGRRPRRSGGKVTIGTADYPGLLLRAAGELSFQTQQGGQCLQGNGLSALAKLS